NCNSVNIPLLENFEPASSTRGCWRSVGAWRLANGASSTTVSASDSVSIWLDFYSVPKNTGGFSLYTPQFAPVPAGTALKFAYAHATYSNNDTDRVVLLTTTNDSTWVSLDTLVGGPNGSMTTAPNSQGPFVPTASQWGAKTYTLPVGTIKVRFQARSDFGNNAYFDNIEIGSTATLTGLLRYNNSASTGLTNSDVRLLAGTSQIASATTGTGGAYTMNAVPAGSYTVTGATTKPWGGVTGADALVISRHFSGAVPLVGLRLKAGDVNNNTAVNSQDALLVSRRFAGTVSSFTAGNWSFEALPVNITAGTVTQNILGLCVGDVNGSYSSIPVRSNAPVALLDGGVLASESDELVIPVSAAKAMEIGASSLVFNLPAGLEIVGVDNALPGADFLYNVVNGQLRSVWYHMDGARLAEGDVLMTIRARRNGALNANLAISNESEIATLWAEALDGAALRVPSLVAKSSTLSLSTYPNPAQDLSVLRFNLNNSARVSAKMTDATGRVVWSQPSAQRNAGQQELMIDTRTLANGVYSVVLTSEVNGEVRVENAKLQVRH
ncbi:MAG: T9SS type A sorting domain-containing protein, partial [Bacteroidota bacterium]